MASTANAIRAKVGFLGDSNSALAADMQSVVDLAPFSADTQNVDAVVVDAASSAAGTLDGATIGAVLQSSRILAIAHPTAPIIAALVKVTGQKPADQPDLIVCSKTAAHGYHTISLNAKAGANWQPGPDPAPGPDAQPAAGAAGSATSTPPLGQTIGLVLNHLTTAAVATDQLDTGDPTVSQLTPPIGATYGVWSPTSIPMSTSNAVPIDKAQKSGDRTAGTGVQPENNQANLELHVYYVDGENVPPYCYVIFKLTGGFNSGTMLANNQDSVGFFQFLAEINATFNDANGNPIPAGVVVKSYSPSGPQQDSAEVSLTQEMGLMAGLGAKNLDPTQFTATEDNTISLTGWAMVDSTTAAGPGWTFYQAQTWNAIQHPPASWPGTWWKTVYQDDLNQVQPMPALSYSTLGYETAAVWAFESSLLGPPPDTGGSGAPTPKFSLPVQISVVVTHQSAFLDSGKGNMFNSNSMYWQSSTWTYLWVFDLGSVAVSPY